MNYHFYGLVQSSCGGLPAECRPSLYLPVYIIPKVWSDQVQVYPLCEPVLTPIDGCPCTYMLHQHICISVPVTYGAEIQVGQPGICCTPLSTNQYRVEG